MWNGHQKWLCGWSTTPGATTPVPFTSRGVSIRSSVGAFGASGLQNSSGHRRKL